MRSAQGHCLLANTMGAATPKLRQPTKSRPIRCAILISGSGSGMKAMIQHQKTHPSCSHETVLVISDQHGAKGLERASSLGIEAICIPLPQHEDRDERRLQHEVMVNEALQSKGVELVLLSGYMRLLTPYLVSRWAPHLLNIHPSLLPAFPGAHAHKDVLASGVSVSGCTVHHVDEGMDSGKILAQRRVPVFPGDTESSLASRVRIEEHTLYPYVVDHFIQQSSHQVN